MNETRTFVKPGRVTIDELAGMTKRRFDELEDQMEYRFDGVDKRLDGVDKKLDGMDTRISGLSKDIKDLTLEMRTGFKSLKSQK